MTIQPKKKPGGGEIYSYEGQIAGAGREGNTAELSPRDMHAMTTVYKASKNAPLLLHRNNVALVADVNAV